MERKHPLPRVPQRLHSSALLNRLHAMIHWVGNWHQPDWYRIKDERDQRWKLRCFKCDAYIAEHSGQSLRDIHL